MTGKLPPDGLMLRAQLTAHPGDHQLRGVWADWLEEHGFDAEAAAQRKRLFYADGGPGAAASQFFIDNKRYSPEERRIPPGTPEGE